MTDFTTAGAGDAADFADAEIREIVVQIETLLGDAGFAGQVVGFLRVLFVAEVASTSAWVSPREKSALP